MGTTETSALPGTNWHPDADGDGIPDGEDLCPHVYDPDQTDHCDLGAPPQQDGPITDLRIEHATPYGAWLSFTSPHTTDYGWTAVVAWSTTPGELDTVAGVQKAIDRGDSVSVEVMETFGYPLVMPVMITSMQPSTDYYIAAIFDDWDGLAGPASNVRKLHTAAPPTITQTNTYPRVWATPAVLDQVRQRNDANDEAFSAWRDQISDDVLRADTDPGSVYLARDYCSSAAVLYAATGDVRYRDAGVHLYELEVAYWEDNQLTANEYRWAEAGVGTCLDLLWNDLSTAQRERGIRAMLEDDEAVHDEVIRIVDTDEYISQARTWLIDGLVACNAPGIDPSLSERACAILDAGKRRWFGVGEVMTRRDFGFWAQSGGALADGSFYGPGTSTYWLQIISALNNAGVPVRNYAPFVRNNLLSFVIHPLTPSRKGYSTWGDIEDFAGNFDQEPNTYRVGAWPALLGMYIGLLSTAGMTEEAGWARSLLLEQDPAGGEPDELPLLLFETSSIPAVDYADDLPTAYWASGKGLLFDRTGWDTNASFLQVQAGWGGVDHSHGDQGHFQWYRNGRWMTHEAAGYDGPAASAWGHNTLLLQGADTDENGGPDEPRQYVVVDNHTGGQRLVRGSSGAYHTAAMMDVTGSYNSHTGHSYYYDSVQRAVLWIKDAGGDSELVIVYDSVDNSATAPAGLSHRWNLQLDAAPTIDNAIRHASVTLGDQRLDVHVITPSTATLSAEAPVGSPDDFPGPLYNDRLVIDPGPADSGLRMITVLRATGGDTDVLPASIAGTTMRGTMVGDQLVLFSASGAAALDVTNETVALPSGGPLRAWLIGLNPSADYTVKLSGGDLHITSGGSLTSDASGVLAVDIDANGSASPVYSP